MFVALSLPWIPLIHAPTPLPACPMSECKPRRGESPGHTLFWRALMPLKIRSAEGDWALVHDAARPCLTGDALAALIDRARVLGEGVILAEPVADTLKQVTGQGEIEKTVDRSILWRAQTPQLVPIAAAPRCAAAAVLRRASP